jgi:adenylate cyclase
MRKVLSRSVDPKVLDHLLERANDTILAGERKVLTVLFADLRGSTEWAERTEPEELVSTLNIFLGRMVDVIFNHGGTLDKFVGDEVIALFGTPLKMTDHALCAAQTALHMQQVHAQIRAEIEAQGRELPPMGIGISSGEVIAGEIGSPVRTDYTAMGRVMNLGARLCSAARPGQIVISRTTYDMIQSQADVQPLEPIALKGIGDQIQAYELRALKVQAHAE